MVLGNNLLGSTAPLAPIMPLWAHTTGKNGVTVSHFRSGSGGLDRHGKVFFAEREDLGYCVQKARGLFWRDLLPLERGYIVGLQCGKHAGRGSWSFGVGEKGTPPRRPDLVCVRPKTASGALPCHAPQTDDYFRMAGGKLSSTRKNAGLIPRSAACLSKAPAIIKLSSAWLRALPTLAKSLFARDRPPATA